MSDTPDFRPIPSQTPLKLPPKPEPVAAPAEPAAEAPAPEVAMEPAPAPVAATAPLPAAAPKPVMPVPAPRPVAQTASPVVKKIPTSPKFVSPMPKIDEPKSETPIYLPIVAGVAAAVTIAFSVLLYLKR